MVWILVLVHSQTHVHGLQICSAVEVYSINFQNILAQAFILIFISYSMRMIFPSRPSRPLPPLSFWRRSIESLWIIEQRCHKLNLSRKITGTLKGHIQLKIKIDSILAFSDLLLSFYIKQKQVCHSFSLHASLR